MLYYIIYSAWWWSWDRNWIKRIRRSVPWVLKNNVLLKFWDLFFNHRWSTSLIKWTLRAQHNNIRQWFSDWVNDPEVLTNTNILLDSWTSKIVAYITAHHNELSTNDLVLKFCEIVEENNILEKYASIIIDSNINYAVTFDIPNPFKIRARADNVALNVFNPDNHPIIIEKTAAMCNKLYHLLWDNQSKILTTINWLWSDAGITQFINLLDYTPESYAIWWLTTITNSENFTNTIQRLNRILDLQNKDRVHFLGAWWLKKWASLKRLFVWDSFSVDVSTPWNRTIDGNKSWTAQSGYFDYNSKKMLRISPTTLNEILRLHGLVQNPLYSIDQMHNILNTIILHQSNRTSTATYDARAKLFFHNSDVYKHNVAN